MLTSREVTGEFKNVVWFSDEEVKELIDELYDISFRLRENYSIRDYEKVSEFINVVDQFDKQRRFGEQHTST